MSLSSLFNLPSAPAQILGDNASAAQGSSNTSAAPLGDAFATYMAQQMSSGQFSKWQNLTSALANQNALGANGLGGTNNGLNNSSMDQTAGFGPSPGLSNSKSNSSTQSTQSTQSNQSAQSGSGSSDSTSTNGSSDSSSSSSTSQASDYAAHRKFSSLNKDLTLLGDTIDSTGADSTDLSASVSTNAMLMGASLARAANQSSDATSTTLSSANGKSNSSGTGKDAGTATTAGTGTLPLVLPSIGAALQAQQNAIKAQSSQAQGGKDTNSDLKTTALSDKVQLITPNQTDTNPQSLISYARGMGLNDSQIHQLFGPDAAKGSASAGGSGGTANSASTAAIIGSGAASSGSSGSLTSSVTSAALSSHISTTDASLSTSAALSASTDPSSSSGSLSPAASSVLGQLSNLQVQIDQAPGAIGIQSEATAATLADATQAGGKLASVGPAGLAGLNGTANNATPISTLEVLSEMDASLRPEDIAALEAHFNTTERSSGAFSGGSEGTGFSIDMNTALGAMHADASAAGFAGSGDSSGSGTNSGFGSSGDQNPQSNNANVPADMAGAYEKLSNKFANEVSTRLQQQFAQGQWKMKFALRPTSLGIVDIQLEMKDGKLAANFQSNNPLTQNLIQTNSHQLRNALQDSGITQSSVQVGSGQTNGQGSNSGQNSGVPYTYQSNPLNTQATATEEIPAADDSTITKSSNSDSQLDIFA